MVWHEKSKCKGNTFQKHMLNLTQSDIHWAAPTKRRLALTERFQNASSIQIYVVVWPCWSLQLPHIYISLSPYLDYKCHFPIFIIPFCFSPLWCFFPRITFLNFKCQLPTAAAWDLSTFQGNPEGFLLTSVGDPELARRAMRLSGFMC